MNVAQHILVLVVRLYRCVISPAKSMLFGPLGHCRFTPTCSAYAVEAIRLHGALRGSLLAIKRIGRCHPWGGCGEDPVPQTLKRQPLQKRPQFGQNKAENRNVRPAGRVSYGFSAKPQSIQQGR